MLRANTLLRYPCNWEFTRACVNALHSNVLTNEALRRTPVEPAVLFVILRSGPVLIQHFKANGTVSVYSESERAGVGDEKRSKRL